ncbi:MAG: VOC family protein [Actinomycetota bacterium]
MNLEGIHHITAITGDSRANLDFYSGVLGLRLVAKSINQDDSHPTYHLFYADEKATPGAELTFFEYPGVPPGSPGAGMVHRITWRVDSEDALNFWAERLRTRGVDSVLLVDKLQFEDSEGLGLELTVAEVSDEPLRAEHPEIPAKFALGGFHGVRAYCAHPERSRDILEETLHFRAQDDDLWEARGAIRGSTYSYDLFPPRPGVQGAGTVHHVAWRAATDTEHSTWRDQLETAGASPTAVIDRYYFKSIYFREPSGVLFEIASPGPGFTRDTPLEHLGEAIALPPWLESQRELIESQLAKLPNPREAWTAQ